MKATNVFKKILTEFNKKNIRYCVLRNYEFLLDSKIKQEFDFDITIQKEDLRKMEETLIKLGFVKRKKPQFSLKHQSYGKYVSKEKKRISFDIQVDGIYWNDISYLSIAQIIQRRIKKGDIYILSDEDSFIMYLCHSILGKRNLEYKNGKYKSILIDLTKKNLDTRYINNNLAKVFNKEKAEFLIKSVYSRNFKCIKIKINSLIFNYILKKPITFTKLAFRWFFTPKYCPLRKIPLVKYLVPSRMMISFIGPDGSGKSTNALRLKEALEKNKRQASLLYVGRGRANILPIKKISNAYKKIEIKKPKKTSLLKTIIYTLAALVYTIDLLLRYLFKVLPKRKSGKMVITDRYASDILLMPNVPLGFKKFLLSFFPKPTLTFYLYNSPGNLNERRKHPVEDIKRQLKLFPILTKKFNAISIKTSNKEKDFDHMAEIVFNKISELGY